MKRIGLLLLIVVLFWSCNTQKALSYSEAKEISIKTFTRQLEKNKNDFEHLKFNAKIKLDLKLPVPNLNCTFYIKNKEKIWANITKFGTQARFNITPERLQGFIKFEKEYIDGDFTFLNQLLKVDFIDYQKLQNLLLGQNFAEINPNDFTLKIENNQYLIEKLNNNLILDSKLNHSYTENYWFNPDFTLSKVKVYYPKDEIDVTVEYLGWQKVKSEVLPKTVKVIIKDDSEQKIELDYSNFEFKQTETPYKVPKGFTKKEF